MEDLKAIATADISQLKKGMADAQKELAKTAAAAAKFDSTLAKGAASTNRAGQALQNLGRVAQDAPFGFIAIQNNLNPLLESFQRLRQESGSNIGALKAFASSLLGAGGLGFALSLVSSILIKYPDLLSAVSDAQKKADATLKEYNTEMNKAAASARSELSSLQALVSVAQNESLSRKARGEAIAELQRQYPGYLQNITQETINSDIAREAINNLTLAIGRKSKVQAIDNLRTKENEKLLTIQNGQLSDNVGILEAIRANMFGIGSMAESGARLVIKAEKNKAKAMAESLEIIRKLDIEFEKITEEQAKGGDFSKWIKPPKDAKKAGKDIETLTEFLAKMEAQLVKINKIEILRGLDKSKEKIQLFESSIDQIFDKFKLAADNPVIIKLQIRANDLKLLEFSKQILSFTKEDKALKIDMPFEINLKPVFNKGGGQTLVDEILREQITKELKALKVFYDLDNILITDFTPLTSLQKTFAVVKKQLADITTLMQDSFANIATGIGESLGKAFTEGGSFLRNALGGVFGIMGDFLVQLGKAAVLTSKLFLAIKASKLNPIVGIIGGIAAIAAGTILKNIKLPAFAIGGSVTGRGSSTSDSILARLSAGEYVMSAATVSKFGKTFFDMLNSGFVPPKMATGGSVGGGSIGGSQLITVQVEGRMRGRDIYFVNQREISTQSRNG